MKREDIHALLVDMPAHPALDRIQDAFEKLLDDIAAGQLAVERMRALNSVIIEPGPKHGYAAEVSAGRYVYGDCAEALADAIIEAERGE